MKKKYALNLCILIGTLAIIAVVLFIKNSNHLYQYKSINIEIQKYLNDPNLFSSPSDTVHEEIFITDCLEKYNLPLNYAIERVNSTALIFTRPKFTPTYNDSINYKWQALSFVYSFVSDYNMSSNYDSIYIFFKTPDKYIHYSFSINEIEKQAKNLAKKVFLFYNAVLNAGSEIVHDTSFRPGCSISIATFYLFLPSKSKLYFDNPEMNTGLIIVPHTYYDVVISEVKNKDSTRNFIAQTILKHEYNNCPKNSEKILHISYESMNTGLSRLDLGTIVCKVQKD